MLDVRQCVNAPPRRVDTAYPPSGGFPLPTLDMNALARRGAELRLQDLETERRTILNLFPDLTSSGSPARRGRRALGVDGAPIAAPAAAPRRKRRKMTAAEKQAASARMKRYWAGRKKARA